MNLDLQTDLDGEVDADDIAIHPALSEDYGWGLPVSGNVFRKVRLRTDVGANMAGIFTLSLSGDPGIRIWTTGSPASTNSPLLACGQTVTNGFNGVSFLSGADSDLYVEAASNGMATLTCAYICHRALQNQPLVGGSKPASNCVD